ncbi:MAG TPA: DUF4832 domain-containing protein [Polyangiaceae bacterium]
MWRRLSTRTGTIAGALALAFGCGEGQAPSKGPDGTASTSGAGGRPEAGMGGTSAAGASGDGARSGGQGGAGAGAPAGLGGDGAGQGGDATMDAAGKDGNAGSGGVPPSELDCSALPPPRSHAARLFSTGDDPSSDPECTELLNPERGLFRFLDLRSLGDVEELRAQGFTLFYGRVLLDDYRDRDLDASLLETLAESFGEARAAGVKALPRFYYADDGSSPDAPLERVLDHVARLAPLLREHSDVISALHAGFVGAWGEWHASTNDLTDPDARETIFDALLAALPASRMVLARRPSHKLAAYGGPLDAASAFQEDALSRVGHLNDCFLGSDDDVGTYQEPGEKAYAAEDSAYTAVGGETCALNPPRSDCASAESELALHHFSFLNVDYHTGVIDGWREQGCFERIRCRLGYRFALLAHAFPERAPAGSTLPFSLEIVNDGYARAYNPRPTRLVLDGPESVELDLPVDIRRWTPGEPSSHCLSVALPEALPPGSYRLGLAFPDPELLADARFAVRFSSGTTWDEARGVNWLDASLTITEN